MKRPDCKATFFIGKNNYNGPKKNSAGTIRVNTGSASRSAVALSIPLSACTPGCPYTRPIRKYDGTGPAGPHSVR